MITKKTIGILALVTTTAAFFYSTTLFEIKAPNDGGYHLARRELKQQKKASYDKPRGHFLLEGSQCAGFTFKDDKTALWTNELFCNEPDSLKVNWIDAKNFITISTKRHNQECPPGVSLYEVISYNGKQLVLKSTWTGWGDHQPELLKFTKAK